MRSKFQWDEEGEKSTIILIALFKIKSGTDNEEFISVLWKVIFKLRIYCKFKNIFEYLKYIGTTEIS